MITVILGTLAQATAVTILAPSLAMPPASYSLPTIKPGTEQTSVYNTTGRSMPALFLKKKKTKSRLFSVENESKPVHN